MDLKILLVDDEPDILEILGEFLLEEGYIVSRVTSANDALLLLEKDRFDLVLSDINMPGMKGYELLHIINEKYPSTKTALITAYDVHDYIKIAKEYDIGSIITKTTPFNFEELRTLLKDIFTENIFGLDKYIHNSIQSMVVQKDTVNTVVTQIVKEIPDNHNPRGIFKGLSEMLNNAFSHTQNVAADTLRVTIEWGTDSNKSGVAVRDNAGTLTKKDVLYWLERNTTKSEKGLSVGLFDNHGKGLFLTREMIDRLVINIKRNQFTEIVLLNYTRGNYKGHRPLWINEF
jgi:YesN/AraC family two-component response regulator